MVPVMARIERAILRLDRPASAWVLVAALVPLFLLVLAPTEWNSNEENYLQLAYSKVAPEKFTTYHAIFDDSKARIVSETLLGTAVKWFGFSYAHIALRLILALLLMAPTLTARADDKTLLIELERRSEALPTGQTSSRPRSASQNSMRSRALERSRPVSSSTLRIR